MLSPKQTKLHVLRYVNICFSAAMSGDNSLQTPKKTYASSVIRLCGSVKDVFHCKNLFKKATEELLALAEAVFGGTLQRHELRPHLVCRPCERRLNNFRAFKAMITGSQSHFQRSERQERVKRCFEVSPSALRTLKSAKDATTHRGLNFAGGAETNATNSLFREDPSLVFSIVTEARDQTLPGSLLARETLGTRLKQH